MTSADLTEAERRLWEAFPRRALVDLTPAADRTIRATVLRALLLGAQSPEPGHLAAIKLVGAHIVGVLDISYADVIPTVPLR